mgnify:FL=1
MLNNILKSNNIAKVERNNIAKYQNIDVSSGIDQKNSKQYHVRRHNENKILKYKDNKIDDTNRIIKKLNFIDLVFWQNMTFDSLIFILWISILILILDHGIHNSIVQNIIFNIISRIVGLFISNEDFTLLKTYQYFGDSNLNILIYILDILFMILLIYLLYSSMYKFYNYLSKNTLTLINISLENSSKQVWKIAL